MTQLPVETIEDTASEWVIRMDGKLTAQEHTQLNAWLAENPRHLVAFLRLQKAWNAARCLATLLGSRVEQLGMATAEGGRKASVVVARNDLPRIDLQNVRLVACQITRNVTVAHDIAQNVVANLNRLPPRALQAIACLEEHASQAAKAEARNWQSEHAVYVTCNEDEALRTLAQLPKQQRIPFMLCTVFAHSAEEAAAELSISVEAVWQRIERAFTAVQKALPRPPSPRRSRFRNLFNWKEPW